MNATYKTSNEGTKHMLKRCEAALAWQRQCIDALQTATELVESYETKNVIGQKGYKKVYETKSVTLTPNDTFKYRETDENSYPGLMASDCLYGPKIFVFADVKANRIKEHQRNIAKIEADIAYLIKMIAEWRPDL